jgi:hypothetical protein
LKETTISKRNMIVIGLLVVVLTGGIFLLRHLTPQTDLASTQVPQDDLQASAVAEQAVEAFFSIDYQEGIEAWQTRFCSLTTEGGCQFIALGSTSMWTKYLEEKTIIHADSTPISRLAATETEQVWQIKVSLSDPLPGSNKLEDTAYVAVSKTDSGWMFDRFLLEPEINAILARQNPAKGYGRNY